MQDFIKHHDGFEFRISSTKDLGLRPISETTIILEGLSIYADTFSELQQKYSHFIEIVADGDYTYPLLGVFPHSSVEGPYNLHILIDRSHYIIESPSMIKHVLMRHSHLFENSPF